MFYGPSFCGKKCREYPLPFLNRIFPARSRKEKDENFRRLFIVFSAIFGGSSVSIHGIALQKESLPSYGDGPL
jgi:hypothetical protein